MLCCGIRWERAYSSYWFARRVGWEPLKSFEAALDASPRRFHGDAVRLRNCAYVEGGLYYRHLAALLEHFRRNQVSIFLFDDLRSAPLAVCRTVYERIGVDPHFSPKEKDDWYFITMGEMKTTFGQKRSGAA